MSGGLFSVGTVCQDPGQAPSPGVQFQGSGAGTFPWRWACWRRSGRCGGTPGSAHHMNRRAPLTAASALTPVRQSHRWKFDSASEFGHGTAQHHIGRAVDDPSASWRTRPRRRPRRRPGGNADGRNHVSEGPTHSRPTAGEARRARVTGCTPSRRSAAGGQRAGSIGPGDVQSCVVGACLRALHLASCLAAGVGTCAGGHCWQQK